jgi:hypothetical protein
MTTQIYAHYAPSAHEVEMVKRGVRGGDADSAGVTGEGGRLKASPGCSRNSNNAVTSRGSKVFDPVRVELRRHDARFRVSQHVTNRPVNPS